MHAFISTYLDYCSSFYADIGQLQIDQLQLVQNAAVQRN